MNLQAVLEDFQKADTIIRQGIEYLQNVLGSQTTNATTRNIRTVNRSTGIPRKRKLTAAAKLRISQAMKARWEARKAAKRLTVVRGKKAA
ncbi:MAG TPA: hypothetical protein VGP89_17845 [Candidatus Angelobacter sp.]|nr:hypothetical protein [Candidatus Angelobacter sp.]